MVRFSKYVVILIFFVRVVVLGYKQTLSLNFGPPNNVLDPYQKKEKVQEKFYLTKILREM